MIAYDEAISLAKADTISDGKVYCSGETDTFYVFIIVPKDFDTRIPNPLIGSIYTAVDKADGRVWDCHVSDPRLKTARKIYGK